MLFRRFKAQIKNVRTEVATLTFLPGYNLRNS